MKGYIEEQKWIKDGCINKCSPKLTQAGNLKHAAYHAGRTTVWRLYASQWDISRCHTTENLRDICIQDQFFILTDMAMTKLHQRENERSIRQILPKCVICGHSDQLKAGQTPKRRAVYKQLATSVSMSQPAQSSPELIPTDFRNQIKIFSCH